MGMKVDENRKVVKSQEREKREKNFSLLACLPEGRMLVYAPL